MPNVSIGSVVNNGFCIGCGACSVDENRVNMKENKYGIYQPEYDKNDFSIGAISCKLYGLKSDIHRNSHDEKVSGTRCSDKLGLYNSLYAGYVRTGQFRNKGSSGGGVSWLLSKLFEDELIEAVVHVGLFGNEKEYTYGVSWNSFDCERQSKSKYFPAHFDRSLEEVLESGKKFALVGVPCFIEAARGLAESDPQLKSQMMYCIGIFCGHMKTKSYSDFISWQIGSFPSKGALDYRIKDRNKPANKYGVGQLHSDTGNRKGVVSVARLLGMDWGLGYFRPLACDWCVDVTGEFADVVFGDAWIEPYSSDPKGNNIVIVRDEKIRNIIDSSIESGDLVFDVLDESDVIRSQAGNFRHRRGGLSARTIMQKNKSDWLPTRTVSSEDKDESKRRDATYQGRLVISNRSHGLFLRYKERSVWLFVCHMIYEEFKYYLSVGGVVKWAVRNISKLLSLLLRKLSRILPIG